MFTPIKNFITYIQRNAGGSAIFGTPTTVPAPTIVAMPPVTTNTKTSVTTPIQLGSGPNVTTTTIAKTTITTTTTTTTTMENKYKEPCPAAKEHIIEIKLENATPRVAGLPAITTNVNNSTPFSDEDDIELQIKSSIMVKPTAPIELVESSAPNLSNGGRQTRSIMRRPSISCGVPFKAAKQLPFIPPIQQQPQANILDRDKEKTEAPYPSSAIAGCNTLALLEREAAEKAAQEDLLVDDTLAAEHLELLVGESYLEVTLPEFPNSEIIVLNCADSASPLLSVTPTDDPLALDQSVCSPVKELLNPLDISCSSSAAEVEETSTASDIWLDLQVGKTLPAAMAVSQDSQTHSNCDSNVSIVDQPAASQNNNNEEQVEELRSDCSDSGLGIETSAQQTAVQAHEPPVAQAASAAEISHAVSPFTLTLPTKPLRSNLKRRLGSSCSDDSTSLNALAVNGETSVLDGSSQQKRPKRSINFDSVKVYYFPRQQGFSCVPSAGGCTLGMSSQHIAFKTMTLAEHAAELRRAHRLQLQEINPRGSSSDESEESEEDYLSEGSGSDLDAESNGFLQPVTPKQRRALLKAAGVRNIDASEKAECRDIRNSREVCGCTCRDFCDPETCACSQAGIKCQVDRAMFPCGCSRDACGNTIGRIEFNPTGVRTHFIHTIMRLEMENRQQQHPHGNMNNNNSHNMGSYSLGNSNNAALISSQQPSLSPSNYYSLQPHSNYSSGYASPAYTSEATQAPSSYYAATHQQHYVSNATGYQMDALDAGLYVNGGLNATPSYGELNGSVSTPTSYGDSETASTHFSSINYGTPTTARPVSPYACFLPQSNLSYTHDALHQATPTSYRACAATAISYAGTTSSNNVATSETAYVCTSSFSAAPSGDEVVETNAAGSNATSFINLSTPVANATRLSQINDMLQHNRNTTATLVAVTQCSKSNTSNQLLSLPVTLSNNKCTNTPPRSRTPSPSLSPASSTTISVEHDDCSNANKSELLSKSDPIPHDVDKSLTSCATYQVSGFTEQIELTSLMQTASTPANIKQSSNVSCNNNNNNNNSHAQCDTLITNSAAQIDDH